MDHFAAKIAVFKSIIIAVGLQRLNPECTQCTFRILSMICLIPFYNRVKIVKKDRYYLYCMINRASILNEVWNFRFMFWIHVLSTQYVTHTFTSHRIMCSSLQCFKMMYILLDTQVSYSYMVTQSNNVAYAAKYCWLWLVEGGYVGKIRTPRPRSTINRCI